MAKGLIAGAVCGAVTAIVGLGALSVAKPPNETPEVVSTPAVQIAPVAVAEVMLTPEGTITMPATADGVPALERFAAPAPHGQGARLAIIMIDVGAGAGGVDAQSLAALEIPVTVALDPVTADVTAQSMRYRAAGYEVAVSASGIGADLSPDGVLSAMNDWRRAIPQAVAMVEGPQADFHDNPALVQQVVVGLKAVGEGLVTRGEPLEIAQAADVPHARIWGVADARREPSHIIEAMDDAAQHALETGGAIVLMHSRPETITALGEWVARPHPDVVLAPASALMRR